MLNLSNVMRQLKQEREQTRAKLGRLDTALKVLENFGTAGRDSSDVWRAENDVSSREEENHCRAARPLGQVEGVPKEEIIQGPHFSTRTLVVPN
jgi:hypothetical protein